MREGSRNELQPRRLEFSRDASRRWSKFVDEVEVACGVGKRLHPVVGLANKLGEHAARIAGVLECVENIQAPVISEMTLERAIVMAEYYAAEALRLFGSGVLSPDIAKAEKVRSWLVNNWTDDIIDIRHLMQLGPRSVREKKEIEKVVEILVAHGWLVAGGSREVRGEKARQSWLIVRNGG